jgi:hypothetical protein
MMLFLEVVQMIILKLSKETQAAERDAAQMMRRNRAQSEFICGKPK